MVFWKVLSIWQSMSIFSFIKHLDGVVWKKLTIDEKYINKPVSLFIHQNTSLSVVEKKKLFGSNWASDLCRMAV